MVAGPYPTKVMFEALKGRVTTLENRPANGGAAVAGGKTPEGDPRWGVGALVDPDSGIHPNMDITGNKLMFSWQRRSVALAGFALMGDHPLSLLAGLAISTGTEDAGRVGVDPAFITRRRVQTGYGPRTYFDFPELPVITDGVMEVYLSTSITVSGYSSLTLPLATAVEMQQDGQAQPGVPNAFLTHLREPDLPVHPAYIARSPLDQQARRAEIIWPASGRPYLLVVGVDGETFHAPLTPGLPQ